MDANQFVGKTIPRVDAEEKVTGAAKFTSDLKFAGMLHGKILRSTYPHAKIISIDVSRAGKIKGVKAVITGKDTSQIRYGDYLSDQTVVAIDKVRYIGEPVAAVAAIDEDTAEEALSLLRVEYEELQPVFDAETAMEETTNPIHERLADYEHLPLCNPAADTNICHHLKIRKGDVNQAFKNAYQVYEDKFTTQMVQHSYLEPHVITADADTSGNILLHGSLQSPFVSRAQLSRVLQLPLSKIRVKVPAVGGGFGGKSKIKLEPIAVTLAQITGKPVKMVMSREDEFIGSVVRHPAVIYVKTGVTRDGKLLAAKIKLVYNTGGYADDGPIVCTKGGSLATGPYQVPNVWVDSFSVYTNNQIAGGMRGFGVPQATWAFESHIDAIAEDLGIDAYEIRLKNAVEEGTTAATGEVLHSVGIKETLHKTADVINWQEKRPAGRGIGIACGQLSTNPWFPSSAIVKLNDDGYIEVLNGATEIGQGTDTILTQITAEITGASLDKIIIMPTDTAITPYDWATVSSRSTFFSGNALIIAAEDVRQQLLEIASEKLQTKVDELVCQYNKVFVKQFPEKSLSFATIALMARHHPDGPVIGKGTFSFLQHVKQLDPETGQSPRADAYWMYTTEAAEVEVDKETGVVHVLKLTLAQDVGKAISPGNCKSQLEGAMAMSLGYALHEEMKVESGKVLNPSFLDYHLPTTLDIPELLPILVEIPHKEGPFGAKGIGEVSINPTAPAISNAVYNAIGVRIKDLPITPEKVLKAMREAKTNGTS